MTGPGLRWIGCRIKGSPILTTQPRAQSHTCKGQRKEIPPPLSTILLECFKSHISDFFCTQTIAFKSVVVVVVVVVVVCVLKYHFDQLVIIRTLPPRPSPPYLFSKQSKFVGECLRIKFIWTSFSARPPPSLPHLLLQAEE